MEVKQHSFGSGVAAEVVSDEIEFDSAQSALEIMVNCYYNGVDALIVHEQNISPAFFDLKTGLAGEILQKFSTYGARLAIVGDFSKFTGKSLRDFIYESNKGRTVFFVASLQEAITKFEQ
jgi:hypothetical protein